MKSGAVTTSGFAAPTEKASRAVTESRARRVYSVLARADAQPPWVVAGFPPSDFSDARDRSRSDCHRPLSPAAIEHRQRAACLSPGVQAMVVGHLAEERAALDARLRKLAAACEEAVHRHSGGGSGLDPKQQRDQQKQHQQQQQQQQSKADVEAEAEASLTYILAAAPVPSQPPTEKRPSPPLVTRGVPAREPPATPTRASPSSAEYQKETPSKPTPAVSTHPGKGTAHRPHSAGNRSTIPGGHGFATTATTTTSTTTTITTATTTTATTPIAAPTPSGPSPPPPGPTASSTASHRSPTSVNPTPTRAATTPPTDPTAATPPGSPTTRPGIRQKHHGARTAEPPAGARRRLAFEASPASGQRRGMTTALGHVHNSSRGYGVSLDDPAHAEPGVCPAAVSAAAAIGARGTGIAGSGPVTPAGLRAEPPAPMSTSGTTSQRVGPSIGVTTGSVQRAPSVTTPLRRKATAPGGPTENAATSGLRQAVAPAPVAGAEIAATSDLLREAAHAAAAGRPAAASAALGLLEVLLGPRSPPGPVPAAAASASAAKGTAGGQARAASTAGTDAEERLQWRLERAAAWQEPVQLLTQGSLQKFADARDGRWTAGVTAAMSQPLLPYGVSGIGHRERLHVGMAELNSELAASWRSLVASGAV